MATKIFATAREKGDVAALILRLGLAVPFLVAGIGKFGPTKKMVSGMFMMAGFPAGLAETLTTLFGALEVLSGVLLIIGLLTRLAAIWQIFVLLSALSFFRFDLMHPMAPAIWKDPGLLGGAIAILLYGAGRYSVDASVFKK